MSSNPAVAASVRNAKSGRELCFLCDLPRMPWAMVLDYSGKTVCVGHPFLCAVFRCVLSTALRTVAYEHKDG